MIHNVGLSDCMVIQGDEQFRTVILLLLSLALFLFFLFLL